MSRIAMTENQSRRTFVKGVAATGTAATGLAAVGGQAGAQENVIGDVTATIDEQAGLVNVNVQNVNVQDVEILRIRVRDVVVNVEDVEVNVEEVITLEDVNVQALNNVQVVVQALTEGGRVIQTATTTAETAG